MKATAQLVKESGIQNGEVPTREQVAEYFTRKNFINIFGECDWTDEELDRAEWAVYQMLQNGTF